MGSPGSTPAVSGEDVRWRPVEKPSLHRRADEAGVAAAVSRGGDTERRTARAAGETAGERVSTSDTGVGDE